MKLLRFTVNPFETRAALAVNREPDDLNSYYTLMEAVVAKRSDQFKRDNLGRMLSYVLGHRPDEFGLVPDSEGFVTQKELLQALHEEQGLSYVRRSHLNEVLLGRDRQLFLTDDRRIKSVDRRWHLDLENQLQALPKILFTAIRRKAHPFVMEKGLHLRGGERYVILSPDRDMALRIGKRRDQRPVILEILAAAACSERTLFYGFGNVFLSPYIPANFIAGPPVEKEILAGQSDKETRSENVRGKSRELRGGTFFLEAARDPDPSRRSRGKKRKSWKEESKKKRRGKRD